VRLNKVHERLFLPSPNCYFFVAEQIFLGVGNSDLEGEEAGKEEGDDGPEHKDNLLSASGHGRTFCCLS
jgi:hypothetical protein